MSIVKIAVKLLALIALMCSCVPAKKYYEIESDNKYFKKKVAEDSVRIVNHTRVYGNQMMKIMSLSEDSIRLHYQFDSLRNIYQRSIRVDKQRLANIQRELENKDTEVTHIEQRSKEIIYSFRSFDIEANTIYRRLERYVQKHRARGAKIDKTYWNVTITLPDDFLFIDNNHSVLSNSGEQIIEAIAQIVGEHPKYHIEIVEYSRPWIENISIDSVAVFTKKDTLQYTIDSTKVDIEYQYPSFEVVKKKAKLQHPASLKRGSEIVKFIECLALKKEVSYSGTIYTYKPKGIGAQKIDEKSIKIIIYPKTTSLLRDIVSLR